MDSEEDVALTNPRGSELRRKPTEPSRAIRPCEKTQRGLVKDKRENKEDEGQRRTGRVVSSASVSGSEPPVKERTEGRILDELMVPTEVAHQLFPSSISA